MQTAAQHWERLLFASGGALALQKCFFYLLDWTWDGHGCPSLRPNSDSPDITLLMTSGCSLISYPIPREECSTGKCSLGVVRAAPDGSFAKELTLCIDQARQWAQNISTAPLTSAEVYTAFCAMWSPAITYPLAVPPSPKNNANNCRLFMLAQFYSKWA